VCEIGSVERLWNWAWFVFCCQYSIIEVNCSLGEFSVSAASIQRIYTLWTARKTSGPFRHARSLREGYCRSGETAVRWPGQRRRHSTCLLGGILWCSCTPSLPSDSYLTDLFSSGYWMWILMSSLKHFVGLLEAYLVRERFGHVTFASWSVYIISQLWSHPNLRRSASAIRISISKG
jgi:hypothetical protein